MRQEISFEVKREEVSRMGGEISETSKKSNVFHCIHMLVRLYEGAVYDGSDSRKLTPLYVHVGSWLDEAEKVHLVMYLGSSRRTLTKMG